MTRRQKVLAAAATTVLLWGSAFPGIKAGLSAYGPGQLALLRYLFASLTMALIALVRPVGLPRLRDVPGIVALGALGFTIYHSALNYGQVTVTAGSASFLTETAPVFATLMAAFFLRERLSRIGWAGILLSFGGAALIALGEAGGMRLEPGALLVLAAALSGAGYFTLQKGFLERYSPMEITAYAMWTGTLGMLVWAPALPAQVAAAPPRATLAVAYIGVLPGAVGYVTYAYVLSKLSVAKGTSLLYLVPLAALPIAWGWHGEVPTLMALAGGVLVLVGVAVVQRLGDAKPAPEPVPDAERPEQREAVSA
jgi:drug/metabolite transporter (DMT)-like permease